MITARFFVAILLYEVPSGYIADKVDRKFSMNLEYIFGAFEYLSIYFASSFSGYVCAYLFFALNVSFISGADIAFLYDTLKEIGRVDDFKKISGERNSYIFYFQAISGLVSGWLASINIHSTVIVNVLFLVTAFIVSRYLEENLNVNL